MNQITCARGCMGYFYSPCCNGKEIETPFLSATGIQKTLKACDHHPSRGIRAYGHNISPFKTNTTIKHAQTSSEYEAAVWPDVLTEKFHWEP